MSKGYPGFSAEPMVDCGSLDAADRSIDRRRLNSSLLFLDCSPPGWRLSFLAIRSRRGERRNATLLPSVAFQNFLVE
jgi:hypothetical protein